MSKGHKRAAFGRASTIAALVSAISLAAAGPASASQFVNRVGGDAFGLRAQGNVLVVPVNLPPQPEASMNQTSRTNSNESTSDSDQLTTITVPGVLTTGLLTVSTTGVTGPDGSAISTADIANLRGLVDADAVHVECKADATGFTGSTSIVNLGIASMGVVPSGTVTPPPNTALSIAGLTITLNEFVNDSPNREQSAVRSVSTGHVNAIHIASTGPLGTFDIVVGHAHCLSETRTA
jgi:hypothetical protein